MAERFPDCDAQSGMEAAWEALLVWPDGKGCIAEAFGTEQKAVEECDVRNCRYSSARFRFVYRYRPGWVGGEALLF